MSLNKFIFFVLFASLAFIFVSCGEKKTDGEPVKLSDVKTDSFENPDYLLQETKKVLGQDVKFAAFGNFLSDTSKQVVAGIERINKKEFGIQFALLNNNNGQLTLVYKTPLLDGAFTKSITQKINFPAFNHDLIYYSSKDYFLGNVEGEVFSNIIDFNSKDNFYAHLFFKSGKKASLFLSQSVKLPEIKEFFLRNFKNDFPDLKIVTKDQKLD